MERIELTDWWNELKHGWKIWKKLLRPWIALGKRRFSFLLNILLELLVLGEKTCTIPRDPKLHHYGQN